jgi:hypothetical protein
LLGLQTIKGLLHLHELGLVTLAVVSGSFRLRCGFGRVGSFVSGFGCRLNFLGSVLERAVKYSVTKGVATVALFGGPLRHVGWCRLVFVVICAFRSLSRTTLLSERHSFKGGAHGRSSSTVLHHVRFCTMGDFLGECPSTKLGSTKLLWTKLY